jgi:hypothetical protein
VRRINMIRNAYIRKTEKRLERLTGEIDSAKSAAGEIATEARSVFGQQVDGIRGKAETVRKRIREVRAAEASDWGWLKKGVEEALDDLKRSVDTTVQWLRKTGSDRR